MASLRYAIGPLNLLPHGVTVAQLILDQFVKVQILVRQPFSGLVTGRFKGRHFKTKAFKGRRKSLSGRDMRLACPSLNDGRASGSSLPFRSRADFYDALLDSNSLCRHSRMISLKGENDYKSIFRAARQTEAGVMGF